MKKRKFATPQKIPIHKSTIFEGDTCHVLNVIPSNSIQCVVTSPPYWGLRDYNIDGQIGHESTLQKYINKLVSIFTEVNRILKPDGLLWVNIGDCYSSGNRGWRAADKKNPARAMQVRPNTPNGLKPKDLIGIPWRLALALQDSGWFLRSDIIWHKPNAMPESVKDRPTRCHEYLFLFAKSKQYYYNYDDAKEFSNGSYRNRRTVWTVNTEPFPHAHFATFPSALISPCIIASSKPNDFILDPFFGAGTVGLVSQELNRKYIGIELNPEYVKIAVQRLNAQESSIYRLTG